MTMPSSQVRANRALKRLLANGRLTGLPKRPSDQELLALLAASRFERGRTFTEAEINAGLEAWLAVVSEPLGIDHVTMRRMLVDSRLLVRTSSGSTYRVNVAKAVELDAVRDVDPADILAAVEAQRQARKQEHLSGPTPGERER